MKCWNIDYDTKKQGKDIVLTFTVVLQKANVTFTIRKMLFF